ncbi:MAG TPA: hypothetical protein VGK74_29160 [Symbiobacteriaceae bacterium]
MEGDALLTLAHLMQAMRQPDREVGYLREAAAAYTAHGRLVQALACRYEIAWSLLTDGRPTEALPALEAASAGLNAHGYPELEIDVTLAWALYHSLCGHVADADALCRPLLRRPDLTDRQIADCAWILGAGALARSDLDMAAVYAADARAAAVQHWWPPQLTRIAELQQRLNAALAQPGR